MAQLRHSSKWLGQKTRVVSYALSHMTNKTIETDALGQHTSPARLCTVLIAKSTLQYLAETDKEKQGCGERRKTDT